MPNPYFRFKQFTIFQDRCAMKVGTDGVLLGAWVNLQGVRRILDIGTGTGLIALMLAQRSLGQPAQIDAVELDADACAQAQENVRRPPQGGAQASPWSTRIQVHLGSAQDYAATCPHRYDLLVSNPPFFTNVSKARSPSRTLARHSVALPQADLLQIAVQLLRENGRLAVIYPPESAQHFQEKAEAFGLACNRKLYVQPTPTRPIKRILLELSFTPSPYQESSLTLETSHHLYTPEFVALIKDFYLKY